MQSSFSGCRDQPLLFGMSAAICAQIAGFCATTLLGGQQLSILPCPVAITGGIETAMSLPARKRGDSCLPPPVKSPRTEENRPQASKLTMSALRILVADDHEVVRRGLCALLKSHAGWEVCAEAADGREAVDKAQRLKPDIVILDIGMPNLNGLSAARYVTSPGCAVWPHLSQMYLPST